MIGFLDETSPQTTANSQRVWSFIKPAITKNTTKIRANTFGFYALNGTSVIDFHEHSRKEDICEFLGKIREFNPEKRIVIVLDNFRSHHANVTKLYAMSLQIDMVYLPPYSPDLNPIEYIWKSIKRTISTTFIQDLGHIKEIIKLSFMRYSPQIGFAREWIEKFLEGEIKYKMLGS